MCDSNFHHCSLVQIRGKLLAPYSEVHSLAGWRLPKLFPEHAQVSLLAGYKNIIKGKEKTDSLSVNVFSTKALNGPTFYVVIGATRMSSRLYYKEDAEFGTSSYLQSRDTSIRHFQYVGVCLHFSRANFNTLFGKSNVKIASIFSEMTLHFNYIVQAVRYGLVKVSYIIQFDVPPHTLDFTRKITFGGDVYHSRVQRKSVLQPAIRASCS